MASAPARGAPSYGYLVLDMESGDMLPRRLISIVCVTVLIPVLSGITLLCPLLLVFLLSLPLRIGSGMCRDWMLLLCLSMCGLLGVAGVALSLGKCRNRGSLSCITRQRCYGCCVRLLLLLVVRVGSAGRLLWMGSLRSTLTGLP